MTALIVIGVVAVICSITYTVAVTVLVSRVLNQTLSQLNSIDVRRGRQLDTLLDRLMTIKWEDYAMVKATDEVEEDGGFYAPDDEEDEDTQVMRPKFEGVPALEREFLEEDFDESGAPRRSTA